MSNLRNVVRGAASGHQESGFTIIELLIATAVFATVLVLITSGIIEVTDTFFKGDNEANTQRVATNALNTISQAIQFSGGVVTQNTTTDVICVGSEQFSYWPGYELEASPSSSDQSTSALVENSGGCTGNRSAVGRELLTDNMRLSKITLTCETPALCTSSNPGGSLWQVEVRVVYGNEAELFNPASTSPPPIKTVDTLSGAMSSDASCYGAASGQQFCAASDISTIVSERI